MDPHGTSFGHTNLCLRAGRLLCFGRPSAEQRSSQVAGNHSCFQRLGSSRTDYYFQDQRVSQGHRSKKEKIAALNYALNSSYLFILCCSAQLPLQGPTPYRYHCLQCSSGGAEKEDRATILQTAEATCGTRSGRIESIPKNQ